MAVLGGGVMGEALISGLLRGGRLPADLLVVERRKDRAAWLSEQYGVEAVGNVDAAKRADTLVLVVKPQDMGTLLDELGEHVRPGTLVVSLAAGITTAYVEARIPPGTAVVRVMPNTPALVDEGMAAISPGAHCDDDHLDQVETMLRAVGRVVRVPEKQQDAVTAISGSGPAYLFYVVEAMIEAGVLLGLSRADRHRAVRADPGRGRARCCARRASIPRCCGRTSPRPAGRRSRRCASSTTTASAPRSSPPSRPRGTARMPWPAARTEVQLRLLSKGCEPCFDERDDPLGIHCCHLAFGHGNRGQAVVGLAAPIE